jgi:CDP-paratose 2-epimerase
VGTTGVTLLITGGCGFLGSNLAARAIEHGDEVVVFDNLSRPGSQANLAWLRRAGRIRFEYGDIRNQNDVSRVVRTLAPEAIVHLAGQVAMTTSVAEPRLDFEVNTLGTMNLLEAVRAYARTATVVYSSTNKVYGDLEHYRYRETATRYECLDRPDGFDESTPLDFRSPYGCSKGAADQYMLDYARMFGLKTVVFRHSSMYGGRQFATDDQGWIGWFCLKAIEARAGVAQDPFTISGTGKQVRDVLHVDDVVRLYFLAVERIEAVRGEAFNIGGGMGNSLSILELLDVLRGLTGADLRYRTIPPRASDQRVFVAETSKARSVLGWRPEVTSTTGLSQMVEWVASTI